MNKNQEDLALLNVKVSSNVKKALDLLKIHPREPYSDVIERLLKYYDQQPLTSDKRKK